MTDEFKEEKFKTETKEDIKHNNEDFLLNL